MKKKITTHSEVETSQTIGYFIYFLFGVIEMLLVFRLIFKILGANPSSGFVQFINSVTQLFIAPFYGIFRQATTSGIETTSVLEPATLIAMIVYAFLAWGLVQLAVILSGKTE